MRNFTLLALFRIALKHLWLIILTAIVFAAITFSYCRFVATPVYSASGSIMVTNGAIITDLDGNQTHLNNTDIVASLNLTYTVTDILKTPDLYKKLSEKTNYKYSYGELLSRSAVSRKNEDSLFITISFTANNKNEAISLVNEFLQLVPDYIAERVPGAATAITTTADSAAKTFPQDLLFSLTAAIIGAAATFFILVAIYSINTVIRGEEDFKERFEVPVIGTIPDFASARNDKYYKKYNYYHSAGGNNNNGNQE